MHNFFKSIAVRKSQGSQFIPDLAAAIPGGFRGKPLISEAPCADDCAACQAACPSQAIMLAPVRIDLGRSLKLRSVSAGGCNGCEMELNAVGNVNFDFGRYGVDFVASPRHADGLVLSGPISRNMASALQTCWDSMPEPKLVIAVGACAISGGVFADCEAIDRRFLETFKPSLYIPGCPTHPLSFIAGIMGLLGITG